MRNSILRCLAKIHETSTERLRGAADISVMKVHICNKMRMNSTPHPLAISRVRVAKSSIAQPISDRRAWPTFEIQDCRRQPEK